MRSSGKAGSSSRNLWQQFLFLLGLSVILLKLPYAVSVRPAISYSYVAGYNNRVAVLVLLVGIYLFAAFTHGDLGQHDERDEKLPLRVLWWVGSLILLCCVARSLYPRGGVSGYEAYFFNNRLQLLAAGVRPYTNFDFPYGPLLLYPSLWLARALHVSLIRGYMVSWTLQWLVGTAMLWAVVKAVDIPVPWRRVVFAVVVVELAWYLRNAGLNYTPFRCAAAAFAVFAGHAVWLRSRRPVLTAVTCIAAVGFCITISMEQAIGAEAGLLGLLLILWMKSRRSDLVLPILLYLVGTAACFAAANWSGMFISFRMFSSGGYANPVLPSVPIFIGLFQYVLAGCCAYRLWRTGRADSLAVALTLAGAAMIPTVLGRCDLTHITSALPAFVVGTCEAASIRKLRSWWMPVLVFSAAVSTVVAMNPDKVLKSHLHVATETREVAPKSLQTIARPTISHEVDPRTLPCDRQYLAPTFTLVPRASLNVACLDTGYFLGNQDLVSLDGIDLVIQEMSEHPDRPLLLADQTLEAEFAPQLNSLPDLWTHTLSFELPRVRNQPITYAPIISYIEAHYKRGPMTADGQARIWYPRTQVAETR